MPSKSKEVEEAITDVNALTPQCGHVNRHHKGVNGRIESLVCTLPDGHTGDHQAEYECLRPFDGSYEHAQLPRVTMSKAIVNGAVVPSEYVKVKELAFWGDAAGTPTADIQPDLDQLARLKQSRQPGIDGKAYEESHSNR
jgi:hypothetical protein